MPTNRCQIPERAAVIEAAERRITQEGRLSGPMDECPYKRGCAAHTWWNRGRNERYATILARIRQPRGA